MIFRRPGQIRPAGTERLCNDQTHIYDDFLDFRQFYQIWPDSVLIEMNDVNNAILKNFEYYDQLPKVRLFLSRIL